MSTRTPTYRVEICGFCCNLPRGIGIGPTFWTRDMGRPTPENLEKVLRHYQASTLSGGCNSALGPQPLPAHAAIIRQSDNKTVAEFRRV